MCACFQSGRRTSSHTSTFVEMVWSAESRIQGDYIIQQFGRKYKYGRATGHFGSWAAACWQTLAATVHTTLRCEAVYMSLIDWAGHDEPAIMRDGPVQTQDGKRI